MAAPFGLDETHGVLQRAANTIHASSDGRGWCALYASIQREAPYEAELSAVRDHLIVLHLDGPVGVQHKLGPTRAYRVIGPGGLFMLPGGVDFGVCLEGYLESMHLYLRQDVLREVAEEETSVERGQLLTQLGVRDPLVEQLALGVRGALLEPDPTTPIYIDYIARVLAAHLLRRHSSLGTDDHKSESEGLTTAQLSRAIDYMESNLARSFGLPDLAGSIDLTPRTFSRRFKRTTGLVPHQYLRRLRVERAKRMLHGGKTIHEIAQACGFTHQEHFTRVFRQTAGITPGAFRREIRC